jgi:hypothetical protein
VIAEEIREEMMQTRFGISAVVLVLSAGASVQTATACSKEAVVGVVDRWTTVLAENNPDTIVALYSKDAVLWGTLSSTVRSDPAGLKSYFVGAFQALPKLTVKFGEQFIRVYTFRRAKGNVMSTKLACSVVPTTEICPNCRSEMTITEVTPIFLADGFEDVTYRCKGCRSDMKRTFKRRLGAWELVTLPSFLALRP